MSLLEKILKQNFIKTYRKTYQTEWFLKYLKRAYIEITQFLTFLVTFESYSNCFFFINPKNNIVV